MAVFSNTSTDSEQPIFKPFLSEHNTGRNANNIHLAAEA
jgi:hypothetical protein